MKAKCKKIYLSDVTFSTLYYNIVPIQEVIPYLQT